MSRRIFAIGCPDCRGAGRGPQRPVTTREVAEFGCDPGATTSGPCQLCGGRGGVFVEVVGPAPRLAIER